MESKLIVPQDVYTRIEADALAWSENQYGHDDVNKDYLEGALHEAMIAQAEYVRLKAQPAQRWVKALPGDDAVQNWFEENIDKECSASSAIYKLRLWLRSLQREFQVKRQQAIGLGLIEDEQPAAEQWTPVATKPEHNVGVLVFIPGEDNHITSGMWDIDNKWVLLDEYRIPEEEVTHWMPLPSFPKGYPANELPDEIGAMIKEIAREELGKKEQPAAEREEDAVAFAEWAGWDWRRVEGKSMWENQKTLEVLKTQDLYERYEKATGKKD